MLVLSRKINEQVLIPGLNITVTVLSIGSNRVQLGIDAPRNVDITRPEATPPENARTEPALESNASVAALLVSC